MAQVLFAAAAFPLIQIDPSVSSVIFFMFHSCGTDKGNREKGKGK